LGDRARPASIRSQFLRFASVGALTTAVQYVVLWFGVAALSVSAALASAAGYALGVLLSYLLNYVFTFRSRQAHYTALPRYIVVFGIGWCINLLLMGVLVHGLGSPVWPSQILTTGIGLVWNFSASRLWAFRHE
jgi:putative flippase GtrA